MTRLVGLFAYEVVDKTGSLITGKMEADHEMAAAEQLRKQGLTVVEVNAVQKSAGLALFKSKKKVGIGDLCLFSRQLAAMLDAGIPLTRALFTLSKQVTNPTLREAVGEVARNVEAGASFSEALGAYPDIFPYIYTSMVRAGEVGGSLDDVLQRQAQQLEQDKSLRDSVRSATMYPIVVLCFALMVLTGMLLFIVPVFVGFFPAGASLPLPTRIIVGVSDFMRNWWFVVLPGLVALVPAARYYMRSPSGSRAWDRMKFRIPVFGGLLHRAVIARFARTLSTLLAGGIPVVQALETAGPASGNTMLADAVAMTTEKIQEGKSIAGPLDESGIFPPMVIQMVAVGEETGSLPTLLTRIAEFYEAEVATMTKGLTAMIEPLMIIFVGITVGFILVSMYLPIFSVVTGGF